MEEITLATAPLAPPPQNNRQLFFALSGGVVLIAVIMLAYFFNIWPFAVEDDVAVTPSPTITTTPTLTVLASPTADATAGWQTYMSPQYGYQVKVPSNWTVDATGSDVYFYEAMGIEVHNVISVIPNTEQKTLSMIEQELRASPYVGEVRSGLAVGGLPAIWWINNDGIPVPEVDIVYKGNIYKITGMLTNQDILATFKFAP